MCWRMWIWGRAGNAGDLPLRGRHYSQFYQVIGNAGLFGAVCIRTNPGCNSKIRIRVVLPNSSRSCRSIQQSVRRTPRRVFRRSGRRSIPWLRNEENDGAPHLSFRAMKIGRVCFRHSDETIDTFRGAFDYSKWQVMQSTFEEPDEYNRIVGEFLSQVDSGRWPMRDPRAISKSITGIKP